MERGHRPATSPVPDGPAHTRKPTRWEGCSLRGRPAIRDKMPVLIDEDLRFEDVGVGRATGHAETRKSLSTNGLRTGTPNQLRRQQCWTCHTLGYRA